MTKEIPNKTIPSFKSYDEAVTDDPVAREFVDRSVERQFGGGVLDELLIEPMVTTNESTFKRMVLPYYVKQSDDNIALYYRLAKSPRAKIRVLDDVTREELFIMPALYAKMNIDTPIELHGRFNRFEQLVIGIDSLRRSGSGAAEQVFVHAARKLRYSVDEKAEALAIINILARYGITPKVVDSVTSNPVETSVIVTDGSDGYDDEW